MVIPECDCKTCKGFGKTVPTSFVETVDNGKYTIILYNCGSLIALRYGEEWRDCCGDGLICAMGQEINELRSRIKTVNQKLNQALQFLEY